jgi:hypothetical protein
MALRSSRGSEEGKTNRLQAGCMQGRIDISSGFQRGFVLYDDSGTWWNFYKYNRPAGEGHQETFLPTFQRVYWEETSFSSSTAPHLKSSLLAHV